MQQAARYPDLDLPPAFTCLFAPEGAGAFATACARAGAHGAGALVLANRPGVVDIAVVLEPEEPLRSARRAFFPCMAALVEAVGAVGPPDKAVTIGWPDTLFFDGARLGGSRLGWPSGIGEDAIPGWLVFGATVIAAKDGAADPGLTPGSTSLAEEGFEASDEMAMIAFFARCLLRRFDVWEQNGFDAATSLYLRRLDGSAPCDPGAGPSHSAIDASGDLLVTKAGEISRFPLLPALHVVSWLDAATGLPRL